MPLVKAYDWQTQQWYVLNGPGPSGPQGPRGAKGLTGSKGPDDLTNVGVRTVNPPLTLTGGDHFALDRAAFVAAQGGRYVPRTGDHTVAGTKTFRGAVILGTNGDPGAQQDSHGFKFAGVDADHWRTLRAIDGLGGGIASSRKAGAGAAVRDFTSNVNDTFIDPEFTISGRLVVEDAPLETSDIATPGAPALTWDQGGATWTDKGGGVFEITAAATGVPAGATWAAVTLPGYAVGHRLAMSYDARRVSGTGRLGVTFTGLADVPLTDADGFPEPSADWHHYEVRSQAPATAVASGFGFYLDAAGDVFEVRNIKCWSTAPVWSYDPTTQQIDSPVPGTSAGPWADWTPPRAWATNRARADGKWDDPWVAGGSDVILDPPAHQLGNGTIRWWTNGRIGGWVSFGISLTIGSTTVIAPDQALRLRLPSELRDSGFDGRRYVAQATVDRTHHLACTITQGRWCHVTANQINSQAGSLPLMVGSVLRVSGTVANS